LPSEFSCLAAGYPRLAYLEQRPVRSRCSDARVLDCQTAIVADCEPGIFRTLAREWHDRGTAEDLAEAVHRRELERAAQPPVIEVTVTTPPEGIPRLELARVVAEKVRVLAAPGAGRKPAASPGPSSLPAWPGDAAWWPAGNPYLAAPPGSGDDAPAVVLPVRDVLPAVTEVQVP